MAIDKIQSESINLADNFAFTGTVTGAGGTLWLDISSILSVYFINKTHLAINYKSC